MVDRFKNPFVRHMLDMKRALVRWLLDDFATKSALIEENGWHLDISLFIVYPAVHDRNTSATAIYLSALRPCMVSA